MLIKPLPLVWGIKRYCLQLIKQKDVLCIIYHLYDPLNNTEKQTILGCNFNGRSKEGRIMWWDINRLNLKYHNRLHR